MLVTDAAGENAGFFREEADLSVIIISDEVDHSTDVSINEFANWMFGAKPRGNVYFSSIVGPDPRGCATAERGTGYIEVTEMVGGILWDICDSDWSDLLTELGLQAAGLDREFFLSLVPVEDSIDVAVVATDGAVVPSCWPRNWAIASMVG